MKALRLQVLLVFFLPILSFSQTWKHYTWYDKSRTKIKESFTLKHAKDTSVHLLDGPYEMYHDNGMQKISGFYKENEADSTWVYYFENGNIKCTGKKRKNLATGFWRYFFENAGVNMEGNLIKNVKEGVWRFYYENGKLKKEGLYINDKQNGIWTYFYEDGGLKAIGKFNSDTGRYTEYYPSGEVKSIGKILGGQSDSIWNYYHPNGQLKARGLEINGLKSGYWIFYHDNGNVNSEGNFKNGNTIGKWKYYHENGKISAEGVDSAGVKEGFWRHFYDTGNLKGQGDYIKGSGDYSEYHENGKLKVEGKIVKGKNDGLWKYYYEDGLPEGICQFENGEGKYKGFYPNGRIKMDGVLKDGEKVGVWNLYKEDGSLAGHLQTVYDKPLVVEAPKKPVIKKDTVEKTVFVNPYRKKSRFRISYFEPRKNEYKSFAIGINPLALILSSFPIYLEYYIQERMGFEFNPILYRDPLLANESNLPYNQPFKKGYALSLRHKFYNNNKDLMGLIYFGYELRYTSYTYTANIPYPNNMSRLITSNEDLFEFTVLFGDRLLRNYASKGWTLDLFMGIGLGYRYYKRNYEENSAFDQVFDGIRKQALTVPVRIGFSAGYLF